MPRPLLPVMLALAALAVSPPVSAQPTPRSEVVSMRFGWPAPARARVTYRRTRIRTGTRPVTFVARFEMLAEPVDEGLRLSTRATAWRGALPYAPALAREAIRASEQVVQRVRADGEFLGLEGTDALRPVLGRVLDEAKVPPDQAERALSLALAATRSEAEELWNLAVGFWTGADLKLGETYAMQSEGELPLLPGVRASQAVEFNVRRRVPCAAGERGSRCVEAVLRSVPDREALERATPQLLSRIGPAAREPVGGEPAALAAESELVLVTDPTTLLPRRLVWTKAVRLGACEDRPPDAEQVERVEYDWRWLPAARGPATVTSRSPGTAPAPGPRSRSRSRSGSGSGSGSGSRSGSRSRSGSGSRSRSSCGGSVI